MTKANRWIAAGLLVTAVAVVGFDGRRPRVCHPVPCVKARPVMAFFGIEEYYRRYWERYRAWQRHKMI